MFYRDVIPEVIETVLGWELSEDELSAALYDRACLIAGVDPNEAIESPLLS